MRKLNTNLTLLNFTELNLILPTNESNKTDIKTFRSELKDILTDCRNNYKEAKRTCMASFKDAKQECKAYKCKDDEVFINGTCVLEVEETE